MFYFLTELNYPIACHGALSLKLFPKFISCKESKTKNSNVQNSLKKKTNKRFERNWH